MEFFKKIRSKPAWMGLAGILVIALVLLVFLIPEKNTTMGETDVSQMNSGGVLENEDAGASEVSEKGTEESTADDKTDAEETSADETSGKKSSTDGKNSKKETAKETSAEKNAETSAAKKIERSPQLLKVHRQPFRQKKTQRKHWKLQEAAFQSFPVSLSRMEPMNW